MSSPQSLGDLSSCDREPIHIPGSIQSRGVLFACPAGGWTVTHVTRNAAKLLKTKATSLLGANLKTVLGAAIINQLEAAVARARGNPSIPGRIFGFKLKGQSQLFNASVHVHDGRKIVEIEPSAEKTSVAPLDLVRIMLTELQQARTLHDLCNATVEQLRQLIGFDRVMIYRFMQDDSGQVIAEVRAPDLEPLLNLRYPASDIPQQARELYKKNWVRLITDVNAEPIEILADADPLQTPLDMSYADLRSVSPIHVEYLKNMGVVASMSISIIVGGALWGLIACHHRTARNVPSNLRVAAELLGQVFSLQIQTVEGIEAYVTMRAARALLDRVVAEFPVQGDLVNNLSARLDQIAAFIPCDGLGIWMGGVWRGSGVAPALGEVKRLAQYVQSQRANGIYATHHLTAELEGAAEWKSGVRGVMAVPLSHTSENWLFFFRTEVSQAIEWGGNPSKAVIAEGASGRLSPRKSFEAWKVEVRGQSLPWTSRERLIGETLRIYLLDIIVRFSDVIIEERRQAEQRQRLAASELNHRVKGTLELIQSLVVHGYSEKDRVQSFVHTLEGRIKAIARAHDTISRTSSGDVRSLLEGALALQSAAHSQIDVHGPDVKIDAKAYTALALVIHEMVSNAASHGALSTAAGKLSVRWSIDPNGRLVILWEEQGEPGTRRQTRDDLGLVIIKRNIPHALGGEADVHFDATGVKASFVIPVRYVEGQQQAPVQHEARANLAAPDRPLEGYTILVVEDQLTMAVELERLLRDRGAASVTIVGTAARAKEAMADDLPDVAILDVDLGDGTSIEIANELARLEVPFIFAANEIDRALIPPQHADVQITGKPYSGDGVAELLKEALLPYLIRAVLGRLV